MIEAVLEHKIICQLYGILVLIIHEYLNIVGVSLHQHPVAVPFSQTQLGIIRVLQVILEHNFLFLHLLSDIHNLQIQDEWVDHLDGALSRVIWNVLVHNVDRDQALLVLADEGTILSDVPAAVDVHVPLVLSVGQSDWEELHFVALERDLS